VAFPRICADGERPVSNGRASVPERPMSGFAAFVWTAAVFMTEQVCVAMTERARTGARTDIVSLTGCTILATSLAVFFIARVHAPDRSLRATLGLRPLGILPAALSLAAGAGLRPLFGTLEGMIARRWPLQDAEAMESVQRLVSSSSRAALVVGVFVVTPVAVEVFFRGILFGEVRRSGSRGRALLLTTALFALYSTAAADARDLPTAALAGLAFGWLRLRTGTVVAPVAAHLAYWAVEVVPILRGGDLLADVVYPTRWMAAGAVIAVLALAAVGWGGADEENSDSSS